MASPPAAGADDADLPRTDERPPCLILLVDDDTRTAKRMAQMLREDGYEVEVIGDGASAIARLTRPPLPDLLVTDLRMPHADGLAVTRFGRAQRPGLPVFIVTGYPNMMSTSGLGEPPPVLFTKPVDYEQLRDEIAHAIGEVGNGGVHERNDGVEPR